MQTTWQNFDRFPQPRDEEPEDTFEAVELCADLIEDAGSDVSDEDFRYACCVALVRDVCRSGGNREDELNRMLTFIRSEFNRKMVVARFAVEG